MQMVAFVPRGDTGGMEALLPLCAQNRHSNEVELFVRRPYLLETAARYTYTGLDIGRGQCQMR